MYHTIKAEGSGHNYLIQHIAGCGKGYSIGWLAHTLTSLYRTASDTTRLFDTILGITDRKVLDKQLQKTLTDLERTTGVVKTIDKNSEQLKHALSVGKDIIVTTIQKFGVIAATMSSLKGRTFAVIVNEVHSSQSVESAKSVKKSLSVNEFEDEEEEDSQDVLERKTGAGENRNTSPFLFHGYPHKQNPGNIRAQKKGGYLRDFPCSHHEAIHCRRLHPRYPGTLHHLQTMVQTEKG